MIYVIDTFAWIEYFKGSKQGLIVKRLFGDGKNKFITMECCLSELRGFCLKNNMDFDRLYTIVNRNSIILPVMRDLWINAAKVRFELRKTIKNFGLIDSILVAKQQKLKCKIVSGDPHFKSLRNVIYLDKKFE